MKNLKKFETLDKAPANTWESNKFLTNVSAIILYAQLFLSSNNFSILRTLFLIKSLFGF